MPSIMTRVCCLVVPSAQSEHTSAISNSNTYVNMSEAYLHLPLIMTLTSATAASGKLAPATAATYCDYTLGLRNWLGSMISSLSVEWNGSQIV
jgi:hypothetical protein